MAAKWVHLAGVWGEMPVVKVPPKGYGLCFGEFFYHAHSQGDRLEVELKKKKWSSRN